MWLLLLLLLIPSVQASCDAQLVITPTKDFYQPNEQVTLSLVAPKLMQVEVTLAGKSYLLAKKPIKVALPNEPSPLTAKVLFGGCDLTYPSTLPIANRFKEQVESKSESSFSFPKIPLFTTLLSALLAVVLVWRR